MFPRLRIDLDKYEHNILAMTALADKFDLSLMAVTKVFCAKQPLVDVINKSSIHYIADSRLLNLRKIKTLKPKVLLRIPSLHEVRKVVKYVDISLNSEMETINALNEAARRENVVHDIILMVDVGDLREGVFYKENIINMVRDIKSLSNVYLKGIGTNLTCYGGIIPSETTLKKLIDVIELIEFNLDIKIELISGGNSSHIHLLYKNKNIPKVNNLRLGEVLVLGRETAYGKNIKEMYQDVITLEADIIELKHKPSIPEGEVGMNAFGKTPEFVDMGLMKRGILGIGQQDVDYHELIPVDPDVRLVGSSSDHIIVDLTHTKKAYKLGDIITFKLTYGSILSLMTSRYVRKTYVKSK